MTSGGRSTAAGQAVRLVTVPKVRSSDLHNYRDVTVALPPSYESGDRAYPVVYMHDGQNLFTAESSYAGAWGLMPILTELAGRGLEAVVVGVHNARSFRRFEYSPFPDHDHGGGAGDRYLAFLIDQVKPLVEARFRVAREPRRTVIAGSSMGGLISLYAHFRRPDIFGAAGALSPSAWFANEALLGAVSPPVPGARLYLDLGEREPSHLVGAVRRLHDGLRAAGWDRRGLRYVEDPEGTHHESSWGRRFGAALPFLLGHEGEDTET